MNVVFAMKRTLYTLVPVVITSVSGYFNYCTLKKLRKTSVFMETLELNGNVKNRIAELARLRMFNIALMFVQILSSCMTFAYSALGTGMSALDHNPLMIVFYDVLESIPPVGLYLTSLVFVGSHFFFLKAFSLTHCCSINQINP